MAVRVYVSEHGNVFMREIAEHLAEALAADGTAATVITDRLPDAHIGPLDQLVVAPHEFFGLFPAPSGDVEAAAARSVSINTEQPGTSFFGRAMHFARCGPVVFDINSSSLVAVRALGLRAVHLPLGYVASMDHWHRSADERGVDIALLAGRTPRRELFLAGAASLLWEWRTELRMFSWHRPVLGGAQSFLAGDAKYASLADTRILLNVHRDEDPYFEWARVLDAAANGCAVVTETSTGCAPFVAGEHFVEAPLEHLAEQAVALALDEPRRVRLARAAYELLRSDLDQAALLRAALVEGGRLAALSTRRRRASPADRRVAITEGRRAVGRLARALLARPTSDARAAELHGLAVDLQRAYVAEVEHGRSIQRTLCVAVHGEADPVSLERSPSAATLDAPVVSVVVPLFNQGRFVREAALSVIAAASGAAAATELIIVDDASTDDSAAVAAKLVGELGWFSITLARRAANGGLAVARNTGFGLARGRYVFTLDADNLLYPSALQRLVDAIEGADPDVLAVYGILERFDGTGSVGITSHLPWDVDLLVTSSYIDAMALFRRAGWERLGGYGEWPGSDGWEDYDLWLRAAEHGLRAELVPSVVGRVRQHVGPMRRISDVGTADSLLTLRNRHPRLPWPS